jgi:hypothetical protein
MTWTYAGDPSANSRDAVRFLVNDTNTSDQLVSDEEIAWAVAEEANVYFAAASVAGAIAASFARKTGFNVDGLSKSYGQKYLEYRELRRSLLQRGEGQPQSKFAIIPDAGGITRDALFTLGQFDNVGDDEQQ